jgi:beta-glucanase (GH16 family)
MRARVPAGPGVWPAFWALPADGSWPPEVDVMEVYGSLPSEAEMTYHWGTTGDVQVDYRRRSLAGGASFSDQFHIYGCTIAPEAITWYLDGVQQWSFTASQEIVTQLKPMYIVCNLAIGGMGGDPGDNTWPQSYVVDYIRAWRPG